MISTFPSEASHTFNSTTINAIGCLLSFILAILIEWIVIPRVLLISKRKRLYDLPDKRKSHKNPIPRLAGITFLPVIMLSFLPLLGLQAAVMDNPATIYSASFIMRLSFVMCGCMTLVLLGIKDDLIGVRYSHKFVIQIIAALLLIASNTYINNLYGLLGIHELPYYIGLPLTLVLVVYIINSINLIDGVDGLAATLTEIATLGLGVFLFIEGSCSYACLAFAVSGMLFTFTYYNTHSKRKIFMGDTGSLTLGYMVAFLAIHYSMDGATPISGMHTTPPIVIAWSVLFVPMFDTIRVMCVRASKRMPVFSPDRNHIHHKLLDLGYSHRKVTYTLGCCALFIVLFNILLQGILNINLLLVLNLTIGILFNLYLNKKQKGIVSLKYRKETPVKDRTINTINA